MSIVVGCATPSMRVPGVQVVPSRVLALPTEGIVWEMDAEGKRTLFEAKSRVAVESFNQAIHHRLSLQGGRWVAPETMDGWPWAAPFRVWSAGMMSEIMEERLGLSHVEHESVAVWRYGPALATWRERLGADYLLVSRFLDGRNTAGHSLMVAFAGGIVAARRAMACVVRMQDGTVVWCSLIQFGVPIDRRGGAQVVADSLLHDLLGPPPKTKPPVPGANAGEHGVGTSSAPRHAQ